MRTTPQGLQLRKGSDGFQLVSTHSGSDVRTTSQGR
jgi:hypothetical protein